MLLHVRQLYVSFELFRISETYIFNRHLAYCTVFILGSFFSGITMARTKPTAFKSTGGKAPRAELAMLAARRAAPGNDEARRRRFRLGTVALREIRKLQKSKDLLITKASFQRFVREVTQEMKPDVWFQAGAIEALQHTTEAFLTEVFEEAQLAAIHAKRITVMPKDIKLAIRMHGWDKTILRGYKTKE